MGLTIQILYPSYSCGQRNEDYNQIILCPHASAIETLANSALDLENDLIATATHPFITDCITMTIHDCGRTTFTSNVPQKTNDMSQQLYDLMMKAATEQDRIGFLSGLKRTFFPL